MIPTGRSSGLFRLPEAIANVGASLGTTVRVKPYRVTDRPATPEQQAARVLAAHQKRERKARKLRGESE